MDTSSTDPRLTARLRRAFNLSESEVPDAHLLECTKGTAGRAGVELGIALDDLAANIRAAGQAIGKHFLLRKP